MSGGWQTDQRIISSLRRSFPVSFGGIVGRPSANQWCEADPAAGYRQQRLKQRAFPICAVACIAYRRPGRMPTDDFCSGHRDLDRIFLNPKES